MLGKAHFIKDMEGMRGKASVYRLDPPLVEEDWEEKEKGAQFVVVSAFDVPFSGPETYIFQADEDGEILNWSEMGGSFKGGLSHVDALEGAGYTICEETACSTETGS